MKYHARALNADLDVSVAPEGISLGGRYIDYADFKAIVPTDHRVTVDLLSGERIEISMLGFSYDGFWEELSGAFAARSLEALFVEDAPIMSVEGEYETPQEKGRGRIELYHDSVCILTPTVGSVRVPLCFTYEISPDGYLMTLLTANGARYAVGRMGYDTKPFFERTLAAAQKTKRERAAAVSDLKTDPPFSRAGIFRTTQPELYWQAAYGEGRCALELFTQEDSATYLYRFTEPEEQFSLMLEEALEAMGTHREIIWLPDEQLAEKPLCRMAVVRCKAVGNLRSHFCGRLIHSASHAEKLKEFLEAR